MPDTNSRKLMSNAFNKLHEQLSVVRSHVETLEDDEAARLLESMEFGLLAPCASCGSNWTSRTTGTSRCYRA